MDKHANKLLLVYRISSHLDSISNIIDTCILNSSIFRCDKAGNKQAWCYRHIVRSVSNV